MRLTITGSDETPILRATRYDLSTRAHDPSPRTTVDTDIARVGDTVMGWMRGFVAGQRS